MSLLSDWISDCCYVLVVFKACGSKRTSYQNRRKANRWFAMPSLNQHNDNSLYAGSPSISPSLSITLVPTSIRCLVLCATLRVLRKCGCVWEAAVTVMFHSGNKQQAEGWWKAERQSSSSLLRVTVVDVCFMSFLASNLSLARLLTDAGLTVWVNLRAWCERTLFPISIFRVSLSLWFKISRLAFFHKESSRRNS